MPVTSWANARCMTATKLRRWMWLWPPFLGAGLHIRTLTDDFRYCQIELRSHWWNRNYIGTHYGGSLYSMTDGFYVIMLIEILGRGYIVWDKSATIRFKKPGKGRLTCEFRITDDDIAAIHKALETNYKYEPVFLVQVVDAAGEVVAEVDKQLYIRKKEPKKEAVGQLPTS